MILITNNYNKKKKKLNNALKRKEYTNMYAMTIKYDSGKSKLL